MSNSYLSRIIRAARLDTSLYVEIKLDRGAFGQAIGLVLLSSIAGGVGASGETGAGFEMLLLGALLSVASWLIWTFFIHLIGTRFLAEPTTESDYWQLLRTIGFSTAPSILNILGVIPGAMLAVFFLVSVWTLVAMVIAVRAALNYSSTLRAAGVCILGWIAQLILLGLLFAPFVGKLPTGPLGG